MQSTDDSERLALKKELAQVKRPENLSVRTDPSLWILPGTSWYSHSVGCWLVWFFFHAAAEMYFLLTLVTGRVPTNISNTSYKILYH